jgi:MinD superfamily P-loop ATPase
MRRIAHDTPVTFSSDEVHVIREGIEKHRTPRCPHCGSSLEFCGPLAGPATQEAVLLVLCSTCDRCAFVAEVVQ